MKTGPLVLRPTYDFVDEVSRDTPAPGGGSVAALAGSLGAALAGMVANLSVGKGKFDEMYDDLCDLAERAQALKDALVRGVDEDTLAFDSVLEAMRMPKDTEEELAVRAEAMQEGYKAATRVPYGTVEQCKAALDLCGRPGGPSRLPSRALADDERAELRDLLIRIGVPTVSGVALPTSDSAM